MTERTSPNAHGMLDVGDGQQIYWEEWGVQDGVPALYLHGGPGGTLGSSAYRRRFDLSRTRLVALEQRGCGRSVPHAGDPGTSLQLNDTPHLVADLEALRQHLGIAAWIVNGVSWGCTLGLAYALQHADRVLAVVGVAVTTTSRREVDWITEGVGAVHPESWERFASHAERSNVGYRRGEGRLVAAYAELLESPEPGVRHTASREWALWEDTHVSIGAGGFRRDPRWQDDRFRMAFARLTAHYWSHDGFCVPPILDRVRGLRDIPATLIHGRTDISSPTITPWQLHRAWPGSHLIIDEADGHGGDRMGAAWREANERLVRRTGA